MIVTHKLQSMDLAIRGDTQQIDAVQDDKYSRNVEFTLTQNGAAWTIPQGTKAVIRFKKPDGTGGNYDVLPDGSAAYTISKNILTVALAPQVCTAPGMVFLAVGLIHGDTEINTFTIHIIVQPNPGVDAVSEDYINTSIIRKLEQIEEDVEDLKDLKNAAEEIVVHAAEISELQQEIADLKYVAINIGSFACSPSVVEMGSTVETVSFTWRTNKTPSALSLNGAMLDSNAASTRLNGLSLTTNRTWTLKAQDERETVASANASISFLNGVYYGTISEGIRIDSVKILSASKTLQHGRGMTFTVNCGASARIMYALPSRYGTPIFNVGGFEGGFMRDSTIQFTNASGYTESYDVWLSDNTGLGLTTVKVS